MSRRLGLLAEREAMRIVRDNPEASAVLVVIVPSGDSEDAVIVGRATLCTPMPDSVTEAVLSIAAAAYAPERSGMRVEVGSSVKRGPAS